MKICTICREDRKLSEFNKWSYSSDGLQTKCRDCSSAIAKARHKEPARVLERAERKKARHARAISPAEHNRRWLRKNPGRNCANTNKHRAKERTPAWADLEAITAFYENCPPGYQVDHILPLQGLTVSGLHVLKNLQYLTAKENMAKGNR